MNYLKENTSERVKFQIFQKICIAKSRLDLRKNNITCESSAQIIDFMFYNRQKLKLKKQEHVK